MNWFEKLVKNQKGVFIVFTAVLLPVIFACAGLAMDLGNAFAHRSKLQNAADAAVLVYGHMYYINEESAKNQTVVYMNANMQGEPYHIDQLLHRQKTNDELMASLYVTENVETTFMKILGFKTIPVSVEATCKIVPKTEKSDSLFNDYVMVAAYDGPVSTNESWNPDKSAIYTNCDHIHIKGKIHSNGPIQITNNVKDGKRTMFVDKGMFSSSLKTDDDLWTHQWDVSWDHEYETEGKGLYINDKEIRKRDPANNDPGLYRHYARLGYYDGTNFGQDVLAKDTYQPKIDISMRKDNEKTKALYEYVEGLRKQYSLNGEKYAEEGKLYLDTDGQYNVEKQKWDRQFNDYRAYRVVVVDGNITINPGQFQSDWEKITVISLHGDIIINAPENSSFKGLIYAPNGKITYYHSIKFEGSMVAQHIMTTASNYEIEYKKFDLGDESSGGSTGDSGSGGSTSGGQVKLYKNVDNDSEYKVVKKITF